MEKTARLARPARLELRASRAVLEHKACNAHTLMSAASLTKRLTGAAGAPGSKGDAGTLGSNGADGLKGLQGLKGPVGSKG